MIHKSVFFSKIPGRSESSSYDSSSDNSRKTVLDPLPVYTHPDRSPIDPAPEEGPLLLSNILFSREDEGNDGNRGDTADLHLRVKVTEKDEGLMAHIFWEHSANFSQYELYLIPDTCNVDEWYPPCDVTMMPYETVIPVPERGGEVRGVSTKELKLQERT